MKLAVTGSSGLIGTALVRSLAAGGHEALRLVRRPAAGSGQARWDPDHGQIDRGALERVDAVVHLAGENIAAGRWTPARKAALLESRIVPTRLLSDTLAELTRPPRVLVASSAVGYYGDRGAERLDEDSAPGDDFLARLCIGWEKATRPAARAGIRVVNLRTGLVLSAQGGALGRMLPPFRLGLGGVLGPGTQYVSWIAIDDMVGVIERAIRDDGVAGPVNAVSPNPVTNRELTKTLGLVLGRPAVAKAPAFGLRLAFGEMADATLLASQRVEPKRLLAGGYRFRFPELEGALRHVLGR